MTESIIGSSCELKHPWRGYTNATIIDDYGDRLLVQVSSGAEISVYHYEIILS